MTGAEFANLRRNTICLTQPELGEILDIGERTIARWEKSEHVPGIAELAILYLVEQVKYLDQAAA
jgi:DNA-binding transcriptional regulator YiaG